MTETNKYTYSMVGTALFLTITVAALFIVFPINPAVGVGLALMAVLYVISFITVNKAYRQAKKADNEDS